MIGLSALAGYRTRIYAGLAIALLLSAAIAAHLAEVYSLEADVAAAQVAKANAERVLANFISAEAQAVSAAVQRARAQERESYANLQKDFDELKHQRAADAASVVDARQRLYSLAQGADRQCRGNVPGGTTAAVGAAGADAGLPPADRQLIDRLLQIGDQANEARRQRDFAVKQYQQNCQKDQ